LYLCTLNKTNKKMKKILTLVSLFTCFVFSSNAQCGAADSTEMGNNASLDYYYSFNSHKVKTIVNTSWHLAFSVQNSSFPNNPANGAAIRVNSACNGTVLKMLPSANPANWRSIDTTGLYAMPQLLDSDSTWNLSAFTKGYKMSDPYNFIWGTYNSTSHNINGSKVYVLYNQSAGWYKKIFINTLMFDTTWNFTISDLDNTDSFNVKVNKQFYPNRYFIYYNATLNQFNDREPVKSTWDLVWTKYSTYINAGPQGMVLYHPVTVLSHPAVTVEHNIGPKCDAVWLSTKTSKVDPRMDAIGWDWKVFNQNLSIYEIPDTFVYFVKGQDGKTYKLSFKSYTGGPFGKSVFNFYEAKLGVNETKKNNAVSIYPNPASGLLTVETTGAINNVSVIDMQGKTVYNTNEGVVDLSGLANGIYVITVNTSEGVYHQHIIKE
jgi:hypothetical protein